jgi:hypothetical protein
MEAIAICNNGQALFIAWRNKKPGDEAGVISKGYLPFSRVLSTDRASEKTNQKTATMPPIPAAAATNAPKVFRTSSTAKSPIG